MYLPVKGAPKMYLSQSQISGWRRKYCLRRRYKGHRIRRFSQGLSRHMLAPWGAPLFHGALTKSPPAIVPESAPFKTARSVCSGESTLCPLDWRRKDFFVPPLDKRVWSRDQTSDTRPRGEGSLLLKKIWCHFQSWCILREL